MLYHTPGAALSALLPANVAAAFVASLLNSSSSRAIIAGVQVAYILMDKQPEVYARALEREGVVHEMRRLAEATRDEDGEEVNTGVWILLVCTEKI